MTDPGTPPERRHRGRRPAIGAAIGVLVAIVTANSLVHRGPSRPRLPDPNGYDDLTRAAASIRGDWPNKGDLAKAPIEEARPFIEANRPSLALARVGLARECVAPFEDSQVGLSRQMKAQAGLRNLGRLLLTEAAIFEHDGEIAGAARDCRDLLELGQATSQGGMVADAQLGWVLQTQAMARLRTLRDRLPAAECRALIRDLESLDRRRVSLDALEARWERWYGGVFGPHERLMLWWNGMEAKGRKDQKALTGPTRDRVERAMRFFTVELAIRAYHEEKGTWPRSVAELVPGYLASVPVDPATGRPLDYPAGPSGELTDDLGSVGRPDGSVAPAP